MRFSLGKKFANLTHHRGNENATRSYSNTLPAIIDFYLLSETPVRSEPLIIVIRELNSNNMG